MVLGISFSSSSLLLLASRFKCRPRHSKDNYSNSKKLRKPQKASPPYGWPHPKGGKEGAKPRQTRDNTIWEEVKVRDQESVDGWGKEEIPI